MRSFSVRLLTAMLFLSAGVRESPAPSATSVEDVVITKLFQPVYPPLAKQTRITGDVELTLEVKADGSVESAIVVSGHPLLKQAAVDSALHSQFACKNCGEGVRSLKMLYSFQLGPTSYCTEGPPTANSDEKQETYPRVTVSLNHVSIIDQPVGTCDLAFIATEKKVRSAKCLYLWRCGSTNFQERPLATPR
jgi:TonB family protein